MKKDRRNPQTVTGGRRQESNMNEGKDRLLAQMNDAEGAVYVLISGFTKEPYVACDAESYDDKVYVYMDEEAAKKQAEALKEEKIR